MQKINRNELEPYPEYNLSKHLLKHHFEMLQFLSFTVYDIITEAFELKHASYMSSSKRGYPVQQFNKQQEIERHFNMISEKLHIRLIRDDLGLDKSLDRLELVWHSRNVPMFHRYFFEKYVYSAYVKTVEPLIQTEEKLVLENKHIFYQISKTINARQACLRHLKRSLAELTVQDVYEYLHIAKQRFFNEKKKNQHFKLLQKGYKLKYVKEESSKQVLEQAQISKCKLEFLSDNFSHLTKLTLYCIDQILKWKEYIYGLTHDAKKKRERLEYYHFQENYFIKILSDTNILKVSALEKFYKFAPKNDPFVLWPLLNFQKLEVKELDNQLLKNIFMPLEEHLPEILAKIQILSEEYKWNIRSRKNYDINVIKKVTQIEAQKKKIDQSSQQNLSNLVLKKIQQSPPKRSHSLKAFRVRDESKERKIINSQSKDKILIEFKTSPKKRATFLPGTTLKTIKETEISPLKTSLILQKNKINPLAQNQVSDDLLKSLKHEVIRKIKLEFELNSAGNGSSSAKDEALQMYINTKINEAIKGVFPFEPEKEVKPSIELTLYRIDESKLSQEISLIIKDTSELYAEMQFSQTELMNTIELAPYIYFIKATVGDQYLATIIVTLDRQVEEFKTLKTLFIGFSDVSQLQMLIKETIKLIEKYENAFEMHFPFFQPTGNEPIRQLLESLEENLTDQKKQDYVPCVVALKQVYSNISETRFIFKRQHKNTNFHPNRFPTSIHFKINLLHSEKKLFLEKSKHDNNYKKKVAYDFLLSDVVRRLYNGQTMNILKEKVFGEKRFRELLRMIVELDKGEKSILGDKNGIRFLQAESISSLNKELSATKEEYPYLELSDTIKTANKVHSVALIGVFSLHYPVTKSIVGPNGQMYFKITVREQIELKQFGSTTFYKFPLKDQNVARKSSMQKYLTLFSAEEYFSLNYPELSTYLNHAITTNPQATHNLLINEVWLPMIRYPQKYQEREDLYLCTQRLDDLQQLKEELFIGEFFEWFCDMSLQNGIKYKDFTQSQKEGVLVFKKPFAVVITAQSADQRFIVYGRIFSYK